MDASRPRAGLHHLIGVELLINFNDQNKGALLRKRQSLEAGFGDRPTTKSHI